MTQQVTVKQATQGSTTPSSAMPPLENGAHLTRAEFERRYERMPRVKKAELIEGVVYMPSPVHASHGRFHTQFMGWLFTYAIATPNVEAYDNATVRLDADNDVQPDGFLRVDGLPTAASTVSDDDYIEGPPELIVEVALSSASYDLHDKKNVYRRNGVQEYLVWRIYDGALDWFRLEAGRYVDLAPSDDGIMRSRVFPGLWLDVAALQAGEWTQVTATLQAGIDSDDHRAFVTQN